MGVDENPNPKTSQETVNEFQKGKDETRKAQQEIKRRHNEDVAQDLAEERKEQK
jgi:hypothetical protein